MNIAKIHVWKVPVLLYGDLADRVLIYIYIYMDRVEEKKKQNHLLKLQQIMDGRLLV